MSRTINATGSARSTPPIAPAPSSSRTVSLAPFLEADQRVFQDPDFGPDQVTEARCNTFTTSYGYNTVLGPGTTLNYATTPPTVEPPGYVIQQADVAGTGLALGTIVPPTGRNFASMKHTAKHDRAGRLRRRI